MNSLPRCHQNGALPAPAGLRPFVLAGFLTILLLPLPSPAGEPTRPSGGAPAAADDLQVEVTKKGLGKEVIIRQGSKEWYMLIEVTEGTSVVIRQEKDKETYIVDESETHDHALSKAEVDQAIDDFINSVKTQAKRK